MDTPTIPNRKDAEKAMNMYATASAKLEQLKAQKKLDLAKIEEKYVEKISDLEAKFNESKAIIKAYAEWAPEIFNDKKSCQLGVGTIGYRLGTRLECLAKFDWNTVVPLLNENYVRTTVEIDKKKLLADFKDDLNALNEVGLTIVQEDAFYVKL